MEQEIDPMLYGVTPSLFCEWRSPRLGEKNPTKIKSKVWEWLVHSKLSAYAATQRLNGPSSFDEGPAWCFDRFGQSVTELEDGRIIYIGGEHEDYYDPDFNIYNDVVVVYPDDTIDFYCYSKSDFPSTDFHSATRIENKIILIGSLGYPEERVIADTQIYILDLESYEMQKIKASGQSPGWIHEHNATLSSDKKSILITHGKVDLGQEYSLRDNIDDWKLNLVDWYWERLTERAWVRWEIKRRDKKNNHLWEIRQALWKLGVSWLDDYENDIEGLENELGHRPDVTLVNEFYTFDFAHDNLQEDEEEHNVFWIYIDAVRVKFVEESHCLQVSVEGELPVETINILKESLVNKLSALENTACDIEDY